MAEIDYAQPLERLARLEADVGDWEAAAQLWAQARQIYEELGLTDDAQRIQSTLDDVDTFAGAEGD